MNGQHTRERGGRERGGRERGGRERDGGAAHLCTITPPYLLETVWDSADPEIREAAMETLFCTAQLHGEREVGAGLSSLLAFAAPAGGRRMIFDVHNRETLTSATVARTESSAVSSDDSVNRAFDGLGVTRGFFADVFDRDSIDGYGMRLDGYVHFGVKFNNAYWNGRQMVFGDGDGRVFSDLTGSLDIIAHELAHGVTEHTAGLVYHVQPGALNESMSDVFGSLVKQYSRNQTAEEADWLIGDEVFTPDFAGDALRSLKAPGTAYDNPTLGQDRQPDHMDKFVVLPDTRAGDWGGVHYNSGIPNRAFHLTATAIGGHAWKAPGQIWYAALQASGPNTQFQEFAETTLTKAAQLYGPCGTEVRAVTDAWQQVGITLAAPTQQFAGAAAGDSLESMTREIERLSAEIQALTQLVRAGAPDGQPAVVGQPVAGQPVGG